METAVAATTRLYTEMGSVFAKMIAPGNPCIVFSYDPGAGRIKAKAAKLGPARRDLSWVVRTETGSYHFGPDQAVLLDDGTPRAVRDLKPGDRLFSRDVQNAAGDIYIQTGEGMVPLHLLIESDLETGFGVAACAPPSTYQAGTVQTVLAVAEGGPADVHPIEIDCPSPRGRTPASGHNFMVWADGTSFGSGIFAC